MLSSATVSMCIFIYIIKFVCGDKVIQNPSVQELLRDKDSHVLQNDNIEFSKKLFKFANDSNKKKDIAQSLLEFQKQLVEKVVLQKDELSKRQIDFAKKLFSHKIMHLPKEKSMRKLLTNKKNMMFENQEIHSTNKQFTAIIDAEEILKEPVKQISSNLFPSSVRNQTLNYSALTKKKFLKHVVQSN